MEQTTISLKSLIAPHFWKTFLSKKPNQIDKGGRGSTKTSKNALKVVYSCLKESNCSAIVLRKYQNTLRNSVYKEIKRALSRFGLIEGIDYKASVSPMEITLYNGNTIYFAGADDYEKIKGMIDEKKPIKIIWFEEVTEFFDNGDSEEDIDNIIATFTRGNNDWFISLYSFNPPKNKFAPINLWTEKMALRDDVLITETDYRTVPVEWLGNMFIEEAKRLEKYDIKRYRWIYLGEVIGVEGMIYNPDLFIIKPKDYLEKNNLKILYIDLAIDSGHQTSATSCGAYGYATDGNWYRLDTYYYSPQEKSAKKSPSELCQDIWNFRIGLLKQYKTTIDRETIDSAEGALRNQMYSMYGIRLNPVNKGENKEKLIEYSQDLLSKGKYIILDNNNNKIYIKEMSNYMWIKDSIEKGKPMPDKKEKEFSSQDVYYNTHSRDYSYYYADHTCDDFQYWVKDNLQKLGLQE